MLLLLVISDPAYFTSAEHLHRLDQHEYLKEKNIRTEININETGLYAPFDYKIDNYETISNILVHDTNRNLLILNDFENNANRFKSMLILSERKAHVELLNLYLKEKFETITVHGDDYFYCDSLLTTFPKRNPVIKIATVPKTIER